MNHFMNFGDGMEGQEGDPLQGAQPVAHEIDYNGDGIPDGVAVYEDTNGDGIFDSIVTSVDIDGDGIEDITSVYVDANQDGTIDYSISAMGVDTDGDGVVDSVVLGEDTNGDAVFETTQIMDAQEWAWFNGFQDFSAVPDGEDFSAGYQQFDPSQTDMNQVVGDPVSDEECWEFQGESGPCAIYAQVMAYEGMTGQDIDPEEMIDVATENGWYNNGTTIEDMDKILNYLGADTQFGVDGDMEDLHDCLENGGRIVVAVDGNEIWEGDNDIYAPNDPNHAVTVIGIDYSGEEPMVIINDSGTMDGHAIMVPESQFMDAWEDSGCSYVEAYV